MFFASTSTKLNLSLFFVFNFSDIKKKKKKTICTFHKVLEKIGSQVAESFECFSQLAVR